MSKAIPKCVGIILDGNRRWAKKRGLPPLLGHKEGGDNLVHIIRHIKESDIKHVVVYAFSTENWDRPAVEVSHLMKLISKGLDIKKRELNKRGVRIHIVGQLDRLPKDIQEKAILVDKEAQNGESLHLWVCLSYGGRAEILDATKKLVASKEEITEENLMKNMWTAGMPYPEVIIRTGGDKRLSNFLLWQCAYSELFFTDTFWPDFTTGELDMILDEYKERDSRKGK